MYLGEGKYISTANNIIMYIKELTPLLVVILLLLYLCLVRWRSAKYKGQIGEKCVSSILSTLPSNYYLFNNIYLQNGTHSTQIDHVIVSPYGIFVIETKNYKGWIYGTKHGEYWTQNIYGVRYSLQAELCPYKGVTRAVGGTSGYVHSGCGIHG